jgi:hypothetical protein
MSVLASGKYPCCFDLSIDKTEYSPGDPVFISIKGTGEFAQSTQDVSVTILEVTYGIDNANIAYRSTKALSNGSASFEFRLPDRDSDRYRYLIQAEDPTGMKQTMFFTKKGGSNILISDVKLTTPTVMQGDELRFEAKIVDGLGNPFHTLRALGVADVPQVQDCDEPAGVYGELSPSMTGQDRYWPNGIISGAIPIMYTARPGVYNLTIEAFSDYTGYSPAAMPIQFEIVNNPNKPKPFTLFKPFSVNFTKAYFTNQSITVSSYTAYNGCGEVIPHVPVTARIVEYDILSSERLKSYQKQEVLSDDNGRFSFQFQPLGVRPGYFSIHFTTTYDGVQSPPEGTEMPHNTKEYVVQAEGKEFAVFVDSWYSIPEELRFNKEEMKLELDVDTSDTYKRIGIQIPNELLNGDFQVLVNGEEQDDVYRHLENFTLFDIRSNHDKTQIQLIGTNVVPEFGMTLVSISVLVALIMMMVGMQLSSGYNRK